MSLSSKGTQRSSNGQRKQVEASEEQVFEIFLFQISWQSQETPINTKLFSHFVHSRRLRDYPERTSGDILSFG